MLVYTTNNLIDEVRKIAPEASIIDIDNFYKRHYAKLDKVSSDVLKCSYNLYPKGDPMRNCFYERIRWLMDFCLLTKEPWILSDIDILIGNKTKIIEDWINTPNYLLYASDNEEMYYIDNANMISFEDFDSKLFREKLPYFNAGFMCTPAGFELDPDEIFSMIAHNIDSWVAEQTAIAIMVIRKGIKTKMIPLKKMARFKEEIKDKTLLHGGPFGVII